MRSTPVGRDEDRSGVAGSGIVDDLIEIENGVGLGLLIVKSLLGSRVAHAHPLVGFARVIQPEVVINGFGSENHGEAFGKRLQAIERAITADANKSLNPQLLQPGGDEVEVLLLFWIDKIARGTDERAALGGIELGNRLIERVQVNVRNTRVEQTIEALDQAEEFELELVGANNRPMDGGIEGGGVATGRKDADSLHGLPHQIPANKDMVPGLGTETIQFIGPSAPSRQWPSSQRCRSGREPSQGWHA